MIVHTHQAGPQVGGIYCPVVVCDACAERVTGHGNVYWLVLEDGQIHPQVWHTHKWPCSRLDDVIREHHPAGFVMSEELGRWLEQLSGNFASEADRATP